MMRELFTVLTNIGLRISRGKNCFRLIGFGGDMVEDESADGIDIDGQTVTRRRSAVLLGDVIAESADVDEAIDRRVAHG